MESDGTSDGSGIPNISVLRAEAEEELRAELQKREEELTRP